LKLLCSISNAFSAQFQKCDGNVLEFDDSVKLVVGDEEVHIAWFVRPLPYLVFSFWLNGGVLQNGYPKAVAVVFLGLRKGISNDIPLSHQAAIALKNVKRASCRSSRASYIEEYNLCLSSSANPNRFAATKLESLESRTGVANRT